VSDLFTATGALLDIALFKIQRIQSKRLIQYAIQRSVGAALHVDFEYARPPRAHVTVMFKKRGCTLQSWLRTTRAHVSCEDETQRSQNGGLTVLCDHRFLLNLGILVFGGVFHPTANSYSTFFQLSSPTSAFVGNPVPFVSHFALEINNPPTGVVSVTESYSGDVSFGDGSHGPVPSNVLIDFGNRYSTAYHAYATSGFFGTSATYNLEDVITSCVGGSCFDTTYGRTFSASGSITIYSAATALGYATRAVEQARLQLATTGNTNPTNLELANAAWHQAISIREEGGASTSSDPARRDAEYLLRGYAGGLLARSPSMIGSDFLSDPGNDFFNTLGPIATALYNSGKAINNFLDHSNAPGALPASSPGGMEANASGYLQGLQNVPIDQLLQALGYGTTAADEGSTPENPIAPLGSTYPDDPTYNYLSSSLFGFDVIPGSLYFIDPEASDLFSFAVAGNTYSSLIVPISSGWDTNDLILNFGTFSSLLQQDQIFTFPAGVSSFTLSGVNLHAGADFTVGTSFSQVGRVFEVTAQAATAVAAVPEPTTVVLLITGLIALRSFRRGRR
jgi:hypothetical protein